MTSWSCHVLRPAVVKSSIMLTYSGTTSHYRPEGDDSYPPPTSSFLADIPNATIGYAMLWISFSSVGHLKSGWPRVLTKWFFWSALGNSPVVVWTVLAELSALSSPCFIFKDMKFVPRESFPLQNTMTLTHLMKAAFILTGLSVLTGCAHWIMASAVALAHLPGAPETNPSRQ